MSLLEIALVTLVSIWTIIFVIIAVAILLVFFAIRRALQKANKILDETEDIAKRVDLPSKVVIASILGFMAKNMAGSVKDIIGVFLKSKKK
ncbi:MAG: hypothetical protein ACD_30C00098G0001 [uncultured bacterium]|uniref:Uncharacterized protein n=4 Tax=Candidatus Daviesiibacteriota TaxID=1752718 RepID=A0A0G0HXK8_9BACT|nr:MAG: hypothetical protein ACD_30C00098G0001 [uncultured bacterium]KKQ08611.1 MAG: hypothetical protein US19_C0021G0027 [Candidatus Daviesbacteria bacterium GW2011_GWB1_36_5]KKQ16347.1 MAG: hypothetical protein US28_C0002G0014 [Candidatus Daviesbacteria bacterium GW2011_GWA1_36_8]OGE16362.1 MAG: hypothetical protein A2858_04130 [Candidatus Daviesbacteria bacterium RIFCSPHIGHO2_01_FULL_36_37]OGE33215.1 MAG: hypothetical protein A3C99_00085 [Candidatus Daviesbacteria bacterium RIFCSPHIGHO2_02_F